MFHVKLLQWGQDCAPSNPVDFQLFYRGLDCLAAGEAIVGFAGADGASSRYGAYTLGQWKMGVTGDTIKIPFIS